jgi:hypothetical protein
LQCPEEGYKQRRLSKHAQEALKWVNVVLLKQQPQLFRVSFRRGGVRKHVARAFHAGLQRLHLGPQLRHLQSAD